MVLIQQVIIEWLLWTQSGLGSNGQLKKEIISILELLSIKKNNCHTITTAL